MSNEQYFQEKKSNNLIDEYREQLAKAEKWGKQEDNFSIDNIQRQAKTKKGRVLSQKIEGLQHLARQVKTAGTVVTADMLTPDILESYNTTYGLSKKDMERLLGDMQRGNVSVLEEAEEVTHFRTIQRSKLMGDDSERSTAIRNQLRAQLQEKRSQMDSPSFQKVSLTDAEAEEYKKNYGLSKKDLEKLSLDIQTTERQQPAIEPLNQDLNVQEIESNDLSNDYQEEQYVDNQTMETVSELQQMKQQEEEVIEPLNQDLAVQEIESNDLSNDYQEEQYVDDQTMETVSEPQQMELQEEEERLRKEEEERLRKEEEERLRKEEEERRRKEEERLRKEKEEADTQKIGDELASYGVLYKNIFVKEKYSAYDGSELLMKKIQKDMDDTRKLIAKYPENMTLLQYLQQMELALCEAQVIRLFGLNDMEHNEHIMNIKEYEMETEYSQEINTLKSNTLLAEFLKKRPSPEDALDIFKNLINDEMIHVNKSFSPELPDQTWDIKKLRGFIRQIKMNVNQLLKNKNRQELSQNILVAMVLIEQAQPLQLERLHAEIVAKQEAERQVKSPKTTLTAQERYEYTEMIRLSEQWTNVYNDVDACIKYSVSNAKELSALRLKADKYKKDLAYAEEWLTSDSHEHMTEEANAREYWENIKKESEKNLPNILKAMKPLEAKEAQLKQQKNELVEQLSALGLGYDTRILDWGNNYQASTLRNKIKNKMKEAQKYAEQAKAALEAVGYVTEKSEQTKATSEAADYVEEKIEQEKVPAAELNSLEDEKQEIIQRINKQWEAYLQIKGYGSELQAIESLQDRMDKANEWLSHYQKIQDVLKGNNTDLLRYFTKFQMQKLLTGRNLTRDSKEYIVIEEQAQAWAKNYCSEQAEAISNDYTQYGLKAESAAKSPLTKNLVMYWQTMHRIEVLKTTIQEIEQEIERNVKQEVQPEVQEVKELTPAQQRLLDNVTKTLDDYVREWEEKISYKQGLERCKQFAEDIKRMVGLGITDSKDIDVFVKAQIEEYCAQNIGKMRDEYKQLNRPMSDDEYNNKLREKWIRILKVALSSDNERYTMNPFINKVNNESKSSVRQVLENYLRACNLWDY